MALSLPKGTCSYGTGRLNCCLIHAGAGACYFVLELESERCMVRNQQRKLSSELVAVASFGKTVYRDVGVLLLRDVVEKGV